MATNKIVNEAATAMVAQAGQMEQVMLRLLN
jgi:flagellin-like hook-associated protein FlgL